MEGRTTGELTQSGAGIEDRRQHEWVLLALLMLLAGAIHAWQIGHTAVAARDSIAFIRDAWRLQHEPWRRVVRESLHPPLYPLTVLAVSLPVRRLAPHVPEPTIMQYSAQIASALAGVLLVIPMFYLGRELFDRRVGFWAALLFQCLPVGSRALSDGLTEGLFLSLLATGLLAALHAFRRRSAAWFALCGLCSGLAYLTRPEGPMLVLAAGLVLLALWRSDSARWTWRRSLSGGASLTVAFLLVSVPYMGVIGRVTNKTSGGWIMDFLRGKRTEGEHAAAAPPVWPRPVRGVPPALILAEFNAGWKEYSHAAQLSWGLKTLAKETGKGFYYVAWLPAVLGLWWFRARWRGEPGAWVLVLLCVLHGAVLLILAAVAGYVSERHTLIFVLCGSFWAAAAVLELPRRLAGRFAFAGRWLTVVELLLMLALIGYGLPSSLTTLHAGRVGHRTAGFWIATHAAPCDGVMDPFCWAHFYAGRVFQEGIHAPVPPGHRPVTFVVLDQSSHHSRIPQLPEAEQAAKSGMVVYQWPSPQQPLVLVYEVSN
jgi:hypothetical protein